MAKELRPTHELHSCAICQRTILKGEHVEAYLAPGGQRMLVCELCVPRAEREGWIRESAHAEQPAARRSPEARPTLRSRLARLTAAEGDGEARADRGEPSRVAEAEEDLAEDDDRAAEEVEPSREEAEERPRSERAPKRRLAPFTNAPRRPTRHVRAVPTNAQVKVERALDVFNASEHRRTVAGLVRTLGEPWVSARPNEDAPSEVDLVVAWELSWYQYRVDLGDAHQPITLFEKGHELGELRSSMREWNGSVAADGALVAAVGSGR